MKPTNSLETRLRSWEPRQPSPKLKHQLFPTASSSLPERINRSCQWLIPAMACLLLAAMLANQNSQPSGIPVQGDRAMTLIQSNQGLPSFSKKLMAPARSNGLNRRIEWTNHNAFTSSISSFLPATAN